MNYALAFTRSPTHATHRRGNADSVETACAAGQGETTEIVSAELGGYQTIGRVHSGTHHGQLFMAVCCDVFLVVWDKMCQCWVFWHISAFKPCIVTHKGVCVCVHVCAIRDIVVTAASICSCSYPGWSV